MTRKYQLRQPTHPIVTLLRFLGKPVYLTVVFAALFLLIFVKTFSKRVLWFPKVLHRSGQKIATTTHRSVQAIQSVRKGISWVFWGGRWRRTLTFTSVTILLLSGISLTVYEFIFKDLPSPLEVSTRETALTTKMFDRSGKELLYSIYKDENRTLVKLDQIPPHVIQATLAIEDAQFYHHPGFSITGIIRAFRNNVLEQKSHGGSTITQQLVKNTLLTSEKKILRKIRELFLAIAVDALYTKEEILEMYFNQIAYGGATYGIQEASQRYFHKNVQDLDLAEAAMLAGIPAAPSRYSPFGSHPEAGIVRQHEVLRRMVEEGFITAEEASQVMSQKLVFAPNTHEIKAPHFVMYVKSILVDMFGETMVSQGGLEVYTTLDYGLQTDVEKIVSEEVEKLRGFRITNGASLVTNPQTGEILAMVGSKNYFNVTEDGQVNLTTSLRQPGSSIKPITYALALERGYTPSSKILDAPITYSIPGSPPYSPKNYDGNFHGEVTLTQALANSYNIPAVKLLSALGVDSMIDKAEQMGIATWKDRKRYGLALTLGGGEVTMTDMVEVYGTFANQGMRIPINPLVLVKDSTGKVIYKNNCIKDTANCPKVKALDSKVAFQISNILSDNQARSSAFGLNSVLHIPGQQVAVKTGTTNSMKDNWTIGYTSDRVAAVWVGNNDGTPMSYVASGITGASPIWNEVIRLQLNADNPHAFAMPAEMIKVAICVPTGTLTCAGCPQTREEYFIRGTEPKQQCNGESFKAEN